MQIQRFDFLKIIGINFFVFVMILVFLEFFCFLLLAGLPRISSFLHRSNNETSIETDARINSPAYLNKKYTRIIYQELRNLQVRYDPNFVWSLVPYNGVTLNIDKDGHRHTCYQSKPAKANSTIKIFMFGGSTLFGTGSDDCNTIPSLLAKQLKGRASPIFQITNFGTTGHVSTQELSHLIAELRKGARPDIVIFYDGVNDVYAGVYSPGIAGAHENLSPISSRFESSSWSEVLKNSNTMKLISYFVERTRRTSSNTKITNLEQKLADTIFAYRMNLEILDSLSHRYDFQYFAFWQPVMLASLKQLTSFEKSSVTTSGILNNVYQNTYKKLKENKEDFRSLSFYDLSDVFDRNQDEIFVDYCHTTPDGNRIVAQVIADKIYPALVKKITKADKNKIR